MGKIKILNKEVAEKIAAGEVVERPLSVIKELVENSIDAKATSIIVEIKKSGKTYIRVTDNGSGIEKDDMLLTFIRYATSKVSSAKDLESIFTLGFRGEALASISAVASVEIISKTREAKSGNRIIVRGGDILENGKTGCPEGTTVIVKDLFFNTPVREKFLKSDTSESTMVIDFITQIALAYPNIKIQLINNDKVLFATSGNGDRLEAIVRLSSDGFGKNLVFIENKRTLNEENDEKIFLEGYISNIGETRNSRKGQIFFVNGRVINSKVIEKAIDEAYKDKLFKGRFSMAYLFLTIDPSLIDVNIHPNKREIRFYDDEVVSDFLVDSIKEGLRIKSAIPNVEVQDEMTLSPSTLFKTKPRKSTEEKQPLYDITNLISPKEEVEIKEVKKVEFEKPLGSQLDIKSVLESYSKENKKIEEELEKTIIEGDTFIKETEEKIKEEQEKIIEEEKNNKDLIHETESKYDEVLEEIEDMPEDGVVGSEEKISTPVAVFEPEKAENKKSKELDFLTLDYQGVIFGTYLILSEEETFYLVDQHAAHERVNYEKMLNDFNRESIISQPIMFPIVITVTPAQYENNEQWIEALKNFGFMLEDFGPNTIKVTGIPSFFSLEEGELFVNNFLDNIDEKIDLTDQIVLDRLAQKACKASVKANDKLKEEEIKMLLYSLGECENPFTCPHGRPTFIKYTKDDIEKKFKRK